jgi:hypothetical protein
MKGDFSRIRFNPAKHYTAVLEQQGRVALDADSNEQQAIDGYLRDTTNIDVIGRFGGPIDDAGFAIEVAGNQILIGRGRYYVDGILVENNSVVDYDDQPFLIGPAYSAVELLEAILQGKNTVSVQLYLEVWQRLVTQLDDPCLREPALGQADTTARLQTVWRVVAALATAGTNQKPTSSGLDGPVAQLSACCQSMYTAPDLERSGALSADTGAGGSDCGCQPIPSAGYQGLENQLYRVEIHTSGTLETATFTWSRENAFMVVDVTAVNGAVVTVPSIGPDANLGFQAGQWVELTDDSYLFGQPSNQPGSLYQIAGTQCAGGQFLVTLSAQVTGLDPARNARMRRWDQSGPSATALGLPLSATPIQLENGIEVTFRAGSYVSGDYWTIPARTASGQIDWPPCGGDGNVFQPAHYTKIHRAPLACIHLRTTEVFGTINRNNPTGLTAHETAIVANIGSVRFLVDDCRLLFPPLTGVNANSATTALHVQSISWVNDDVMTVDSLVEKGLSVTFDQAPACPWGGGNFRVTLETPKSISVISTRPVNTGPNPPDWTDVFLRQETVLDPFAGISVSGAQVIWLSPAGPLGLKSPPTFFLYQVLNTLLSGNGPGWGRVRIKLDGGAIYANGANGNIYLDGQSFGSTGARVGDGSQCIQLGLPSGNATKASDFESWFYLAPTVRIASVIFQGTEDGVETTLTEVWVGLNGALQNGDGASGVPVLPITNFQALITLTSAPVPNTVVSLTLSGVSQGWAISIAPSVIVLAGQISVTAPINVSLHVAGATDTVTLLASVTSLLGNLSFSSPQLIIHGLNVIL